MGIDMVNGGIGEHCANGRISFARLGQGGVDHHSSRVESSKRKNPAIERWRDFILINGRLARGFAHEDCMAGPIGIVPIVGKVIDEQQWLTCLGIVQLDAARKCRLAVGNHPDGAMRGKLLVAEADQMGELGRVDA